MKLRSQLKKWQCALPLLTTSSMVLAACTNNNDQYAHEVVFSLAQGKYWPMTIAMKKLIPLYNDQAKNEKGFLPVKVLFADDTKLTNEAGLLNDTVTKIKVKDPALPSLILNTNTAASTIHAYGHLLDVSSVLNAKDIAPDLLPLYQTVTGVSSKDPNRLYALPFNLSSTESVVVNLPVLRWMLDLAKEAGATVTGLTDHSTSGGGSGVGTQTSAVNEGKTSSMTPAASATPSEENNVLAADKIIEDASKISKEQAKQKLQNTIWNRYELDNAKKTSLQHYTINDDTFTSWDTITEFGKQITSILKLKTDKKLDKNDDFASVVSGIYVDNVFFRRLWETTGSNQNSYIYQYRTDTKTNNQVKQVSYVLLNDTDVQNKMQTAFTEFQKYYQAPDQTRKLKATYYDGGLSLLRTFKSAIGISPNVGIRHSVQSDLSKRYYANDKDGKFDQAIFNSFAKFDTDVKWYHQLMKTVTVNKTDDSHGKGQRSAGEVTTPTTHKQLQTYIAGGSSLIPISINEEKDTALKLFLKWLYKGEAVVKTTDGQTEKVPTVNLIEETSGYFIPLASNYGDKTKVQARIKWYETQMSQHQNDDDKYLFTTLKLSAEDYLRFLAAKQTPAYNSANETASGKNNNHPSVLFNPAGDINTAQLNETMTAAFNKMGQDNVTAGTSFTDLLNSLKTTPIVS